MADEIDEGGTVALKEDLSELAGRVYVPKNLDDITHAKNYFETLGLAFPYADALGHPVWDVTESDIKRQFRKMSILTHPDKNRGAEAEAQAAFELVQKAKNQLLDTDKRADIVKEFVDKAKVKQESSWVPPTSDDLEKHLESEVRLKKRKEQLQKRHFDKFQKEIKERAEKKKKEQAEVRRQKKEKRKKQREAALESSEDEDKPIKIVKKKRHRRNMFC